MNNTLFVGQALAIELTADQLRQVSGGECECPYLTEWECTYDEFGNLTCVGVIDCVDDI